MLNSPSAHPFASLLLPLLKLRSEAIARKMVGVSPATYAEFWARLEELVELTLLLTPGGNSDRYVSFGRWSGEGAPKYPTLEGVPVVDAEGTKTIGAVKVEYRWNPGRWFAVATIPIGVELREILELEHGEFFRNATELRTLEKDGETKEAAIGKALEELGERIGGPIVDAVETIGAREVAWLSDQEQVVLAFRLLSGQKEQEPSEADLKSAQWFLDTFGGQAGKALGQAVASARKAGLMMPATLGDLEFYAPYPEDMSRGMVAVHGEDAGPEAVEAVKWGKCPLSAPGGCRRRACWESGKCQAENVAVGGGEQ